MSVSNTPSHAQRALSGDFGRLLADLLTESGTWMLRRKESVELLDDAWVRRRTTLDYSLRPAEAHLHESAERMVLPFGTLPKLPPSLMRFDVRDEEGLLALPTRRQNALASYAALLDAVAETLGFDEGTPQLTVPRRLREELMFVALAPPEYAEDAAALLLTPGSGLPVVPQVHELPSLAAAELALATFAESLILPAVLNEPDEAENEQPGEHEPDRPKLLQMRAAIAADPNCQWLLRLLAANSLVVVSVAKSERPVRFIKLGYDENIFKATDQEPGAFFAARLGWNGYPFSVHTPHVGARSYHFEFLAPAGLDTVSSLLVTVPETPPGHPDRGFPQDEPAERDQPDYDFVPKRGTRVHLYAFHENGIDSTSTQVQVRVPPHVFAAGGFWAAAMVALTVLACAVLAQPLVRHAQGATSLLLLFPGVVATLVARGRDHAVIIRLLQLARRALLLSAGIAFLAAALLSFVHTGGGANAAWWHYLYWSVLGVAALGPVAVLYLSRRLPAPEGSRPRLQDIATRLEKFVSERALKRARRRQRRLRLLIVAPGKSRTELATLCRSGSSEPDLYDLKLTADRKVFAAPLGMMVTPPQGKTLALFDAGRGDHLLRQRRAGGRQLANTLRWLGKGLPDGYELQISWRRRLHRHNELKPRPHTVEEASRRARAIHLRLGRRYIISVPAEVGDEETS